MKKKTKYGVIFLSVNAFINALLGFAKLFVGLASNSVCIVTDGINSFGDVFGCAGGAFGLSISEKKPTEKHPYGFKNAEHIATLIIAQILFVVGCVFTYLSIERLIFRRPVYFNWLYFGIIAGTLLVKVFMFIGYKFAYKKVRSDIIKCESLDSFLDMGITSAALIGYSVSVYTGFPLDAIVGIIIGCAILIMGFKILKSSASKLIGEKAIKENEND